MEPMGIDLPLHKLEVWSSRFPMPFYNNLQLPCDRLCGSDHKSGRPPAGMSIVM